MTGLTSLAAKFDADGGGRDDVRMTGFDSVSLCGENKEDILDAFGAKTSLWLFAAAFDENESFSCLTSTKLDCARFDAGMERSSPNKLLQLFDSFVGFTGLSMSKIERGIDEDEDGGGGATAD